MVFAFPKMSLPKPPTIPPVSNFQAATASIHVLDRPIRAQETTLAVLRHHPSQKDATNLSQQFARPRAAIHHQVSRPQEAIAAALKSSKLSQHRPQWLSLSLNIRITRLQTISHTRCEWQWCTTVFRSDGGGIQPLQASKPLFCPICRTLRPM